MLRNSMLLAATLLLSACAVLQQVAQPPQLRITDMSLAKAGLMEQVLALDLRLDNPNPFSLPLAGMRYTVELGGVELGTGEQTEALFLPAGGSADWPVTFRINSLRLVQTFLEGGGFQGADYRIHGQFFVSDSANGPALPFDKRGRIGQGRATQNP